METNNFNSIVLLEEAFIEKKTINNQSNYYELYSNYIKSEISKFDNDNDKIKQIVNLINEYTKEINNLLGKNKDINRKILELKIDILKEFLEPFTNSNQFDLIQSDYKYYPVLNNPDFNLEIYKKYEFNRNKSSSIGSSSKVNLGFRRSSSQKFVKNFISPHTPYNGILLYHEVGVGKTCAALGISENFRDYIINKNKKILVLTPSETLIGNWKNEIINVEKEINKINENKSYNVQCTGTRYLNEIINIDYENKDKLKKQTKKIINKYYEFMGYQKLANDIKKKLKHRLIGSTFIQKYTIDYIKERFSNMVIIMDEVHETRIGNNKKDK